MGETLKLKRHETFSIREGWLEKALNFVRDNPNCFKKENGTRVFGIGTNMVKSLRYWVEACGLVKFEKNANLSPVGELIYQYDQYIESDFSWWIIHCNLAMNENNFSPVFNAIFNLGYNKFEKEFLFVKLKEHFETIYGDIGSESSLDSDISIFIKSYFANDYSEPENNLNCPLGKLGLLNLFDKKTYIKTSPSILSLDYRVIYYSLIKLYKLDSTKRTFSFNLEDLYKLPNNPLKIFNLTKSSFLTYLELLRKNGYIQLVKTAGLNTITFDDIRSIDNLFKSYFGED